VIDHERLSSLLGVPVIPTIAVKGIGLQDLMIRVVETTEQDPPTSPHQEFDPEVERHISRLTEALEAVQTPYPRRWLAIKLLEGDDEVERIVYTQEPGRRELVSNAAREIQEIHGHDAPSVIASERYAVTHRISAEVTRIGVHERSIGDRLNELTSHPVLGYVFMLSAILAVFMSIFAFGDWVTGYMDIIFAALESAFFSLLGTGPVSTFIWRGIIDGVLGGIGIALPYIVPFYIVLSVLEA